MNPLKLLQLKSAWERFEANHPKFPRFLSAVSQKGIQEGTLVEFTVTPPDGEPMSANLKIQADDISLFHELQDLLK